MRRLLAGLVVALASGAVSAADFPVLRGTQSDTALASPTGGFSWAGVYAGAHSVYSNVEWRPGRMANELRSLAFANYSSGSVAGNLPIARSSDDKIGYGGFIGYNWDFENAIVGVELDYTRSRFKGSDRKSFTGRRDDFPITGTYTLYRQDGGYETSAQDYFNFKVRGGYAFDRIMPFGTIGVAVSKMKIDGSITQSQAEYDMAFPNAQTWAGTPNTARVRKETYVPGLSLGFGVDYALLDNVFVRAEFQNVFFSDFKGMDTTLRSGRLGAAVKF